jgi:hypothetical protein
MRRGPIVGRAWRRGQIEWLKREGIAFHPESDIDPWKDGQE